MRVVLKSGEIFYQTKSLKKFPSGEIAGLSRRLKEEDSLLENFHFGNKDYLVSSMPLQSKSGNFLGVLQIFDYRSELAGELRGYHRRVFSSLMLFYALTLATIFFAIQKNVNRPIASLLQEVRGASSSDAESKRRKGHELSWLQQEFRERNTHLHELKHVISQNSREREVLLDQLKRSEKLAAIGKFAAGLAHEMGSPLSVIEGRSEQALRKIQDPDLLKKNLELISGALRRALSGNPGRDDRGSRIAAHRIGSRSVAAGLE
ncbi:MAG: hypothetical protein K8R69_09650, partial [Deltaproteobacteria bacterium]|nr:hypothetical protein [Deltaproteobacteria bacterium]